MSSALGVVPALGARRRFWGRAQQSSALDWKQVKEANGGSVWEAKQVSEILQQEWVSGSGGLMIFSAGAELRRGPRAVFSCFWFCKKCPICMGLRNRQAELVHGGTSSAGGARRVGKLVCAPVRCNRDNQAGEGSWLRGLPATGLCVPSCLEGGGIVLKAPALAWFSGSPSNRSLSPQRPP